MARKSAVLGGIFLLLAAYIALANDGRHYWHEFRELYSATFYSTTELMQGVFDAGPAPLRTPQEVAAWYSTKLFHIYLLRQLVNLFGTGLISFQVIKALYVAMLLIGVGLIAVTLSGLGLSKRRAALIIALLVFSPGIVYLGFKLMAEVPALLCASAAVALFTQGFRDPSRQLLLSSVAGVALAVSALASWTVPFLFVGFWCTLGLLGMPTSRTRKPMALASLVTWTSFATTLIIGLWLLGGSLGAYFDGVSASFAFTKPLPMWMFAIFNIGLWGMGLWLLVPFAWMSTDRRTRLFFLVWLVLSGLPVLVLTSGFMEPRYLTAGLVPFVGLAALGADGLWERLQRWNWRPSLRVACLSGLTIIVFGATVAAQSFMPYEANAKQLIQAVRSEAPLDSDVILLPWNYSDFHLLRFVFPEKSIYLVQSAATERGEPVNDPAWTARRTAMYGKHFLPDPEALPTDVWECKTLYIGWTILPSLQNLQAFVEFMRLPRVAGYLGSSRFINHMAQSWVLEDPQFRLRQVAEYGQYHVYEVKSLRHSSQAAGKALSAPDHPAAEVPLWGVFETSFTNQTQTYSNPFADTELAATFRSPSGQSNNFFGFYDGDGQGGQAGHIWKLRFMCIEAGTWTWSAAFIDGAPGGSGSFQCVADGLPGPLRVDRDNPRWLKRSDGNHFFPRWYYLHELLFTKEGIWQQDVDRLLSANGYNMVTVLTTQAEHLLTEGWAKRDYQRPLFYPWIKSGRTVRWDQFDLASWHKLDRVLRYLQERDIYVYFFDGFFPNIPPRFPDEPPIEMLYLRYLLARTGVYWNVVHNIAFEFSEFMSTSRLTRIGRYTKQADPFGLLLTVHDTQNFDALVQSETWLDFANLQYKEGTAGSAHLSNTFMLSHAQGKPVAGTEVVWEGARKLNAVQVRHGAWGIVLASGFFLYGEFDLNGTGVGDFGAGQSHSFLKILFDFIHTIPYWTMTPHNELVDSGHFCLADPGRTYVAYAETGGPITIDLSALKGTLRAEWLNPRTGQRIPLGEVFGGTKQRFANPTGDANDWVLHLGNFS